MTDIDDKLAALRAQDDTDFWTEERITSLTQIPLRADAWQQISITLEDIPLIVTLRWNEVAAGWYMNLLSQDESVDIKGIRLSPGINILDGLALPELGYMYVTDEEQANTDPDFDGLGDRYILWYLPLEAI